jgi:hypothetical protein
MKRKGGEFNCSSVVSSFFITDWLETLLLGHSLSKKSASGLKFSRHGWQAHFSGYKFPVLWGSPTLASGFEPPASWSRIRRSL